MRSYQSREKQFCRKVRQAMAYCGLALILGLGSAAFANPCSDVTAKKARTQSTRTDIDLGFGQIEIHDFTKSSLIRKKWNQTSVPVRPVTDYEPIGAFFMSAFQHLDSPNLIRAVIENVAPQVPVIFYGDGVTMSHFGDQFGELTKSKRPNQNTHVVLVNDVQGRNLGPISWTQDHLAHPVVVGGRNNPQVNHVTAEYRWRFDVNRDLMGLMTIPKYHGINEYFEWGNFVVNGAKKTAYLIGGRRLGETPAEAFVALGVSRVVILPQLSRKGLDGKNFELGIAHADERILFLSDDTVATDVPEYATFLEKEGYNVIMLPEAFTASAPHRTYANGRIINSMVNGQLVKKVLVPAFAAAEGYPPKVDPVLLEMDQQALMAYRNAGYQAIPVLMPQVADAERGGVHCHCKVYPDIGQPYDMRPLWTFQSVTL